MKKKRAVSGAFSAAKVFLGVIIGGVVASTAVAVFAVSVISLEQVNPVEYFKEAMIVSPRNGDVVGNQMKVQVSPGVTRGVASVELYADRTLSPLLLGRSRVAQNGLYTITVPTGVLSDHSYESLYALIYPRSGQPTKTDHVHVQIDGCADGPTCLQLSDTASTILTGLEAGSHYQLSLNIKSVYDGDLEIRVVDPLAQQETVLATCHSGTLSPEWISSPSCTFTPQSGSARVSVIFPDTVPYETVVYLDAVEARKNGDAPGSIQPDEALWEGESAKLVSTTPVTTRKPFAPNSLSNVTSNFQISDSQSVGVWFFKGWPRSHYSWWMRLGIYERPSLWTNPAGAYSFQHESDDSAGWYSPLTLWFTRETQNPDDFLYTNPTVTVTSDIGNKTICLPDLDWSNPLINGTSITGLVVDQFGNTYYAGRYNDPDKLIYANAAKLCTCSDGTAIGQCSRDKKSYCNDAGILEPTDCRTCGCAGVRETCTEQADGAYACERVPLDAIDVER